MRCDKVPERAGFVVTAAVWKFDRARNKMRLQQVVYEPRSRRKAENPTGPDARIKRGALAAEQGSLF